MWILDASDFALLRGGGGQPFTRFVDALIRTHGFVHGVGEAEILTCLRTNLADGGVDTQVRRSIANDRTEYFRFPTCWQYKAYGDISLTELRKEVQKDHARELIGLGYAYRLAICADLTAEKQNAWEQLLTDTAREIFPDAPEARVVTTSQLASWASQYLPLVAAHFHRDLAPAVIFEAWAPSITKTTPIFVPVEEWRRSSQLIEIHVNLTQPTADPIIQLQGKAGVGKTRLVHEIVAKLSGASNLVFYTTDGDDAVTVARSLANDPRAHGILVADECSVLSRDNIRKILKGHTDRVRAVCIDSSGDRLSGAPELSLDQLSPAIVETVLEKNFSWVSPERRREYSRVTGGYIRLAALMCEHNANIQQQGLLIHELFQLWLPDERQKRAVEAISLVQKVGFGEGVEEELDALCSFTGHTRREVLEVASTIKDAPGFIARTTRYLYITPEIIAAVAFKRAWRRWFEPDPEAILRQMPSVLLPSFQARVAQSASPEVRALTGQFFWNSVVGLRPSDLSDPEATDRLATLINTNPDLYFPRLALLVRQATLEELRQDRPRPRGWSSRRTLVSTAESLAQLPQYFPEAEEILRRLAIAETEEGISNNATGVWKRLFRIQLSGTPISFSERIALLGKLLFSSSNEERDPALRALEETLHLTGGRLVGPSVIAGQFVPPDWRPSTAGELRECLELIVRLIDRVLEQGTQSMRQVAWRTLSRHTRPLLSHGLLPTLQAIFERRLVPEEHLPDVIESVEHFLQYECRSESGTVAEDPYCRNVAAWLAALRPSDFVSRLKATIGKDPWHHSMREQLHGVPSEIMPLAEELNDDPAKVEAVLPYLNSAAAASANLLGDALARLDGKAFYLDRILGAASQSGFYTFAVGYFGRLWMTHPEHADRLIRWLDRMEADTPELAYSLGLSAPGINRPLERTLRMIGDGKISVHSLRNFVFLDQMSSGELRKVLDVLVQAGDPQSLFIAVDFIGHWFDKGRLDSEPETVAAIWSVLEASAPIEDRADYWWVRLVQRLAKTDPDRASDVAILALTGDDFEKENQAWSVLHTAAEAQPDIVMQKVGIVLLDPDREWRLRAARGSGLFQSLPLESVQRWLATAGIEGARSIAHHLEPPSVDGEGMPVVPPLTEFVLARWGDDERVFSRFAASTHHMQMYGGDIATTHKREAEHARLFLSHPIPAIRLWAEYEVARGEKLARDWAIQMEEQFL